MNYMFNGNGTIIRLIVGLIKKIWYKLGKILGNQNLWEK